MTIRNFSRFGVDLLRPEVPIFGRRSVVVYEFPLFQAIAAQLTRLGLSAEHSGRAVGLASLLIVGVMTTLVARRIVGERYALVAGAALLFSPFSLFWGSSVTIEYFAVALVLGTIFAVLRWNETQRRRWLIVAVFVGCLAAAVKFSTVVPWAVVIALIFSVGPGTRLRRLFAGAGVMTPVFFVGVGWSLWADHVKMSTAATKQLTTSGMIRSSIDAIPRLGSWYIWRIPAKTIVIEQYAWVGLVALVAAALALRDRATPNRRIIAALLALPLIAVAVFPVQYKFHDYYLAALTPSFAILIAVGIERLSGRLTLHGPSALGARAMTFMVVLIAAVHPAQRAYAADRFPKVREFNRRAAMINAAAPKGRPLGLLTNSWNPTLTYLLDRDVFLAWEEQSIAAANWLQRGIRDVAVGFGPPEMLSQIHAPWIGSDSPGLISLANARSELRDSTVASTATDVWTDLSPSTVVECGPEGVGAATPNGEFVVRAVDAESKALIRFGDVVAIPIQNGAAIRPGRQPRGSQLVCPLGPTKLRITKQAANG